MGKRKRTKGPQSKPAPALPEPRPESDARKRTLQRMKTLLAAGAAVGLGAVEAGCGNCCDPLPPPLECAKNPTSSDLRFFVNFQATWVEVNSSLVVRVEAMIYPAPREETLAFSADPILAGATVGTLNRQAASLTFDCVPDVGAQQIDIDLPLLCSGLAEVFQVRLTLGSDPKAGDAISFTLRE